MRFNIQTNPFRYDLIVGIGATEYTMRSSDAATNIFYTTATTAIHVYSFVTFPGKLCP